MPEGKQQPLVTVVIPAYNVEPYIAEAIDSALAQTYKNIEIIVAVGKSKDNTDDVLKPYVDRKQIILIEQTGRGLSNARNIAIAAAHGDFIALLDGDDIFMPEKIERQVATLLDHPEYDVCYCAIWHFYQDAPDELRTLAYTYYTGDAVFHGLLRKNFIAPLSVVVRRSALERAGGFNESYPRSEDWECWLRLLRHSSKFIYLPEPLAKSRVRPGSMTQTWSSQIDDKKMNLRLFTSLRDEMSPEERRRYHMGYILLRHRLKLWFIYVANILPPLQWLYQWLQKNRRK